jgi:hypothetical protein
MDGGRANPGRISVMAKTPCTCDLAGTRFCDACIGSGRADASDRSRRVPIPHWKDPVWVTHVLSGLVKDAADTPFWVADLAYARIGIRLGKPIIITIPDGMLATLPPSPPEKETKRLHYKEVKRRIEKWNWSKDHSALLNPS